MKKPKKQLVLGCGRLRAPVIVAGLNPNFEFENPVYLDINPECKPDVVWDLNKLPLPFENEEFDEVHAYSILEHFGKQGDYKSFFEFFNEIHRIMKSKGLFFGIVPAFNSMWAFGDPGHTRIITSGTLVFLDQEEYEKQIGKTAMTDYRNIYFGNFKIIYFITEGNEHRFVLEKR